MQALGIDIGGSSVKVVWFDNGRSVCEASSSRYANPTPDDVRAAIANALVSPDTPGLARGTPIGLCLPGLFDHQTRSLTTAVNVPQLVGVNIDDLLMEAIQAHGHPPARVVSDAHAAAFDFASLRNFPERVFALSLGTGVGASVLDRFQPLRISGNSPGHFGQLDVTLNDEDPQTPIGRDGGRGSLEAYIGMAALTDRYGTDPAAWTQFLDVREPALRALIRAIRIAHAIYRPRHIALLGGVGLTLKPIIPQIHAATCEGLSSIAHPDWSLYAGESAFHAAAGAARLAMQHALSNTPATKELPRAATPRPF